jgi:hypothetical protein
MGDTNPWGPYPWGLPSLGGPQALGAPRPGLVGNPPLSQGLGRVGTIGKIWKKAGWLFSKFSKAFVRLFFLIEKSHWLAGWSAGQPATQLLGPHEGCGGPLSPIHAKLHHVLRFTLSVQIVAPNY